jgi:hypothetical protein
VNYCAKGYSSILRMSNKQDVLIASLAAFAARSHSQQPNKFLVGAYCRHVVQKRRFHSDLQREPRVVQDDLPALFFADPRMPSGQWGLSHTPSH